MAERDPKGTMASRLRDSSSMTEEHLRLLVETLSEPTTQMVEAAWTAVEQWQLDCNAQCPPALTYRVMLGIVMDELLDPMKQHADTNGLAKLNDMLDGLDLPSRKEPIWWLTE